VAIQVGQAIVQPLVDDHYLDQQARLPVH